MKRRIEKPLLKSLVLIASMIEARDAYTGGHLWRVSKFSRQLADAAGLPPDMVFLAGLVGFLHDIGKVGAPSDLLQGIVMPEPERLESIHVKIHPGIGATLIQEHPLGDLALAAVHQHHERIDGLGYPDQLMGEQISVLARIVCIADAFDALTSTRPYRQAGASGSAVEELNSAKGSQFDAILLATFVQMVRQDAVREIMGHSQQGVPLVACPSCGPVITVSRTAEDGSIGFCRVCGSKHRLHRQGDTFDVEPVGELGTAEQLRPRPEIGAIETFVARFPDWIKS